MAMNDLNQPNIFEFLDIREFLTSYYRYRKSQSTKFSYEIWSNELGVKSRSLLRMIVMGKRQISAGFGETLSYGFKFSSAENEYYFLLIQYTQSKTKEQKNFFWKKMLPLLGYSQKRKEMVDEKFLSSHWLPKIQTLMSFSDIEKTSENIASILGINAQQAAIFLEELEKISSVKKQETAGKSPVWSSEVGSFKVPEALQNSALRDYYIQSFEDAKQAIALPPETRKYRSLMVPLAPEEYQDLISRLEEVFQEVLLKYNSDLLEGRRLYQLNSNLIPMTKPLV